MPFTEDLSVYLADFGKPVVWGSYSTLGLKNEPGAEGLGGFAVSNDPQITYITSELPGLTAGESITVDGVPYETRAPMQLDDGAFSVVGLQTP
jgi:hypothetical protein